MMPLLDLYRNGIVGDKDGTLFTWRRLGTNTILLRVDFKP